MPFIDDALLWCPDNDGRMVDISACLPDAVNGSGTNQQDNSGSSCDLSSLDPLCNDSDELLRQLQENSFELESFFTEFTGGVDIKEENNNDVANHSNAQQNYIDAESSIIQQNINTNRNTESSHNDLLSLSGSSNQHNIRNESRFSAANPLLAEKLLSPSLSDLDNLTISNGRLGRPRDIKGERFRSDLRAPDKAKDSEVLYNTKIRIQEIVHEWIKRARLGEEETSADHIENCSAFHKITLCLLIFALFVISLFSIWSATRLLVQFKSRGNHMNSSVRPELEKT